MIAARRRGSRAHILVVDDDAGIRHLLRHALERAGHSVSEAEDGRAAEVTCRSETFNLMVVDLVMPRQEGIETIRRLRQGDPNLKILAISGIGNTTMLKIAKQMGANHTLEKPLELNTFVTAVDNLLQSTRS